MTSITSPKYIGTTIKIDKNIPIPKTKILYTEFPFHKMEVGDSFFVTKERYKKTTYLSLKSLLYVKSKEYIIDNSCEDKFSFSFDRQNKGVRCWRIE